MWNNIHQAVRSLIKSPGFTAVAVLSIALGIGANTTMFTLIDAAMWKKLPVREPERLVIARVPNAHLVGMLHGSAAVCFSYPHYKELRDRVEGVTGLAARRNVQLSVTWQGESDRVLGDVVSGNFFEVLGAQPALGRYITPEDDKTPGGHPVAVLSHGYWSRRFGADPRVVGSTILVNGQPVTVLGVTQPGFYGVEAGSPREIYVPMAMTTVYFSNGVERLNESRRFWVQVMSRLKPGVSAEQAAASLNSIYGQLLRAEADKFDADVSDNSRKRWLAQTIKLQPGERGYENFGTIAQASVRLVLGAVGCVLLIACANVASLLLGRGIRRMREFGVRVALGAKRSVIIGQLMVESLVLALFGGALGVVLSFWGVDAIRALMPRGFGLPEGLAPDGCALLFTLALSLVAGILFGLLPAFRSAKVDVSTVLKSDSQGSIGGGNAGLRNALVIAQVALSVLLLVGAALFLATLRNLRNIELGFNKERLMLATVNPSLSGYTEERARAFFESLQERVAGLPDVRDVAMSRIPIVGQSNYSGAARVEGFTGSDQDNVYTRFNWITPGYFRVLGVPLLGGRHLSERDHEKAPRVALVNETFVKRYFQGRNPIGHKFGLGGRSARLTIEIVGVVKDTKYRDPREKDEPTSYFPIRQGPVQDMTLHIRAATAAPEAVIGGVRRELRALDQNVPMYDIRTMAAQVDETVMGERALATLTVIFGTMATILAAVGLYSVLAFSVARRTREIGIRMAMGAQRTRVHWMILRETLILSGAGIVIGLCGAWILTRYLTSMLYEVRPMDPRLLGIVVATILLVAALSGYLPARRAAQVDPMIALRYE